MTNFGTPTYQSGITGVEGVKGVKGGGGLFECNTRTVFHVQRLSIIMGTNQVPNLEVNLKVGIR